MPMNSESTYTYISIPLSGIWIKTITQTAPSVLISDRTSHCSPFLEYFQFVFLAVNALHTESLNVHREAVYINNHIRWRKLISFYSSITRALT